ncbi:error-prone DNA polymerase [Candidatus Skiveiella danica]|uniref:error-prone DNA polymerase n=1 Tax=Candidatus Skiveiella danica TaxID=3386177 RepID=UPI0039B9C438
MSSPSPAPAVFPGLPAYAELHCRTNFSFQVGASHAEELVARAHALGYTALAITDECSVAGLVRAHAEAKKLGLKLLAGSEFVLDGGDGRFRLIALAHNLNGWGALCEFITAGRRAAPKGEYRLGWQDVTADRLPDCELILAPDRLTRSAITLEALCDRATLGRQQFGPHFWLAAELLHGLDDDLWLTQLEQASAATGVPLVAAGDVVMHVRSRKVLHDVLTAVRLGTPVAQCGFGLQPNAEAHLRPRLRLAALYPPGLLANTTVVAARCRFSLDELRYQYPMETVLPGTTPAMTLRHHTEEGARVRYPQGVPAPVQKQIEHELALIAELQYEMYFLTVHDLVRFARSRGILCQGRGSAANSAVCYCLGVTEVDPARMSVLFERFISRERNEPPDIDVDFEHQRREEVIQYIYAKYGRERAALTAVVICWRTRSALRDAGRALGMDLAQIDALAKEHYWFDGSEGAAQRVRDAGLDPEDLRVRQWLETAAQLLTFPRHLSQHVGGFVLTQGLLTRLVPVENAAMPERSIIQWDKDDLDAVGLLKVDVLALGMLSVIRRCLALVSARRGVDFRMQDIPGDDPATWDMICAADTVGVFQIESRAQMSMLPRLKPRCFYDLVIEVAIVRPGPIQGGMVHPYLRRRQGLEPVEFPQEALREALGRTLGVPIFQEQVMQIAMLAAGFSAGEADSLRRSMAAWKRKGGVHKFHERIVGGMVERGYTEAFAQGIFRQIEGFGEYGFPESHAASFALLVWVSCWLKRHEPAAFLAAMLNSQPLGFYTPSQLVQDARRHHIEVRPIDVTTSDWDCTLEEDAASPKWGEMGSDPDSAPLAGNHIRPSSESGSDPISPPPEASRILPTKSGSDPHFPNPGQEPASKAPHPPVRLGLRLVATLSEPAARRILAARQHHPFTTTEDLALRAALDAGDLKALAAADALTALSGHRRQQVWDASALHRAPELLREAPTHELPLALIEAGEGEAITHDYAATGLTLRRHPLALLRPELARWKLLTAAQLRVLPDGTPTRACGIVTVRQQPGTAKGVTFVTLEDETGTVNVIVWKALRERQRRELVRSRLLAVQGTWQRDVESGGEVRHLIATRLRDLTPLLGDLMTGSRDFH